MASSGGTEALAGVDTYRLERAPDHVIGDAVAEAAHARIMQIELSDRVVRQMRDSAQGQKNIQLIFGKVPTLKFGDTTRELKITPTKCRQEVYRTGLEAQRLAFTGLVSHVAALQQAQKVTAGVDAAVATLKANLASLAEEKEKNRAVLVENNVKSKSRRLILDESTSRAARGASAPVPRTGVATAAPSASDIKEQAKEQAAKFVLLHLLAVGVSNEAKVAEKTRMDPAECSRLLGKWKLDEHKDGRIKLRDRYYKELDVWNFPYTSQDVRQRAIDNAISANDRERLAPGDEIWQKLLPTDQRGKGTIVSRLKINNLAGAAPPSTLGNNHRAILRGLGSSHQRSKSKESVRAVGSDREDAAKPKKAAAAAKAAKKSPDSSVESSKPAKTGAEKRKAVSNPKVKSAEFVYDSDEDALSEASPATPAAKRRKINDGAASKPQTSGVAPSAKSTAPAVNREGPSKTAPSKAVGTSTIRSVKSTIKETPSTRSLTSHHEPAHQDNSTSKPVASSVEPLADKRGEKKPTMVHKRNISTDASSGKKALEPSPLWQVHSAANTPQQQVVGSDVESPSRDHRHSHNSSSTNAASNMARSSNSPKTSPARSTSLSSASNSLSNSALSYSSTSPEITVQQLINRRDASWCRYYDLRMSQEKDATKAKHSKSRLWELWRDASFWASQVQKAKPGAPELTQHSVPARSFDYFDAKLKQHEQSRRALMDAIKSKSAPTTQQETELSSLDSKISAFSQLRRVAKDADLASRNRQVVLDSASKKIKGVGLSRQQTMNEYKHFHILYGKYCETVQKMRSNSSYPTTSQAADEEAHSQFVRLSELRQSVLDGILKLVRLFNQDPSGTVTRKGTEDSTIDPPGAVLDASEADRLKWKTQARYYEWHVDLVKALEQFGLVAPEQLTALWDRADELKRDARRVAKAYALDFGRRASARLEDVRYEELFGTRGWEIGGDELESRVNGRV